MWIVYVSVLLNLFGISHARSPAGGLQNVGRHSNVEFDGMPSIRDVAEVDYRTMESLFDLFGSELIVERESDKIDQQQIRARRAIKQQNEQQKSSEQQFERSEMIEKTVSDQNLQMASRNTAGHVAGPTTRLLDESTDDRAQLEHHYRQLEAVAIHTERKANSAKKKPKKLDSQLKRLQGVGVRGRLMCGSQPLAGTKIKLVDVDPRPDRDDLMAETRTDYNGLFHLSGATREESDIEVILKIYHDCLDEETECQRKSTWRVPSRYHNNGTLTEWFDVGTVNMELGFIGEERDCRH